MSLAGKRAVVTGAAGAIGAAVAASLIARGAQVLLLDRSSDAVGVLAAKFGPNALAITIDLGDAKALGALQLGNIDILINNAGVLANTKIADTELEDWRRVHAINVEAALLLTQAVLPHMRAARWGRIVNMSSYAAKSGGLTAGTAYSVSKAAMIGLTFATARETAGEGITVNAIAPAYVMSPMISEQLTADQRLAQLAQIPVGRFCEPDEVSHTVDFLVSPLAGFITGEVIDMNGGMHFD